MDKSWWNSITEKEQRMYKHGLERKINKQRKVEIGDLVRIAAWCKNKFRIAHVVEVLWWDDKTVKIQYLDSEGLSAEPSKAIIQNLEIINESR